MNIHSIHGKTINPIDISEQRSAGGSSGGSAAAVAAGMCDALVFVNHRHGSVFIDMLPTALLGQILVALFDFQHHTVESLVSNHRMD